MSRLYYPPENRTPTAAPGTPAPAAATAAGASDPANFMQTMSGSPDSSAASTDAGEFTQKIVKMVPTELVTAYTAAVGVISDVANEETRMIAYAVTFLVCLILTPIYLNQQAEAGKPKVVHIVLSTLAFPVWAYLVSGNQIIPEYYDGSLALLATILFSVVTGAIPLKK